MRTLFDFVRPALSTRGAAGRSEPGATTNGSGLSVTVAGLPAGGRVHPRVVVVAGDPATAHRYVIERYGSSPVAGEVVVVTDRATMARLDGLQLRRSDRIEWVQGWYRGPDGRSFAAMLENCAAVGAFGTARHVFVADE